jgi:Ca2+-binding RTX toxin-like protein
MNGSMGTAITLTSARYSSVEVITGTASNETIDASAWAAAITLDGGSGDDMLTGGSASDVLKGGAGDDSLTGGLGDDKLEAGTGLDDTLAGGEGADKLFAVVMDSSEKYWTGLYSTGQFSGNDGDDVIHFAHAAMGSSTVDGGDGKDTLVLYMSDTGSLAINTTNFPNAKFTGIEVLDFSKDSVATNLTLTSAGIEALVDNNVAGVDLVINLKGGQDKYAGNAFEAGSRLTSNVDDWTVQINWVA